MHRYDVMRLAHTLAEAYDADFGYSLRLAWQVYRVLKDKAVSAAFWMGFEGVGSYMELLIWDAARKIEAGDIAEFEEYFNRIDDSIWDEFDVYCCDMLEHVQGFDFDYRLSAYGEAYLLAMRERMYSAAVPVNLFSRAA